MAAAARTATRALRFSPTTCTLRTAARQLSTAPRQAFRSQARRAYTTSTPKRSDINGIHIFTGAAAALLTGTAFLAVSKPSAEAEAPPFPNKETSPKTSRDFEPQTQYDPSKTAADYQAVYNAIAQRLIDYDEYDDGSYGPVVLRLGWHSSGTYDKGTGTGGSNGATMRFPPVSTHAANAGLHNARDFLEPIKAQFPWITYSDLWTLAAICAAQEMGGPTIPWRPGRSDHDDSWATPSDRLPDGSKGENHIRAIFGRMGFNDQEMVALSGAHAVGRCHRHNSGFEGPWTFSPTMITNEYFKLLLNEGWHVREWEGERQWEDDSTKSLMMLPTDYALIQDERFRGWVERYAGDEGLWFRDFAGAVVKLFELGVPFKGGEEERMEFVRLDDLEE